MDQPAGGPPRPVTPTTGGALITIHDGPTDQNIIISVLSTKDSRGRRALTKFQVNRPALIACSEYFAASLRFNKALGPHTVELKDDDSGAMRVVLLYMHATKQWRDEKEAAEQEEDMELATMVTDDKTEIETRHSSQRQAREQNIKEASAALYQVEGVHDTNIERIWHIINLADKYLIDRSILYDFFANWYTANVKLAEMKVDFARQLALPCYMFDHAIGFAAITKWLAYNFAGHITENRPTGFKWKHMHLSPPDFVGPMNHARGGLKTRLHRGLWDRVGRLHKNGEDHPSCTHWAQIVGTYFHGLAKIKVYPLEDVFPKNSVSTILSRMQDFGLAPAEECGFCSVDWHEVVANAREDTEDNFDGLCLDCMDRSRPKKDDDRDYWTKCKSGYGGRWDLNCRLHHGQQTWYVSWCGRDEHRRKLLEEKKGLRFGTRTHQRD